MRKTLIVLCLICISVIIAAGDMGYEISLGYNLFPGLHNARTSVSGGIEANIYNRFNNRFEVGFGANYNYAYIDYYDYANPHNQFLSLFIGGKINIYEHFGIFKDDNSFRTIYISPRAWHRITEDVFEFYPGFSLGIGFNKRKKEFTWGSKIIYHIIITDNEYVPSSIVGFGIFIAF